MNKKVSLLTAMLLVAIFLLSACSAPSSKTSDSANAQPADKYEFLDARLARTDYSYVIYGVLEDIHTLIGDDEVVVTAIRPVNKGGVDFDDYGIRTAFASSELFENIGMETYISDTDGTKKWITLSVSEPRYWKLTMANCDDGGGFIDLPEFILSAEEVNIDDIPQWDGM